MDVAQGTQERTNGNFLRLMKRLKAIICELAPDGTVLYVNEAVASVTGHDHTELLGTNWWETLFPGGQRREATELCQQFKLGDVTEVEMRIVTKDCSLKRVSWTSANEYADDGTLKQIVLFGEERGDWRRYYSPTGFLGIPEARNSEGEYEYLAQQAQAGNRNAGIPRKARARKKLAEAEQRAAELGGTIMAMADGVAIVDLEGNIVLLNPAMERILGLTNDDIGFPFIGQMAHIRSETVDGKPLLLEQMPTWRSLELGETNCGVMMAVHNIKTGKVTWVSNSSAPIRSQTGNVIGAVTTFADVTSAHDLQELRENFLDTVSHDLRAPLTVIYGQAQVLQRVLARTGLSGIEEKSATAIVTNAQKMNAMIQDILDSARLDSGELYLDKQPIELAKFITELLDRNCGILDTARIDTHVPSGLVPVNADSDRLERIFINLLTNALKYSEPLTRVQVKAMRIDDRMLILVADRGYGISPEDLPHIFERFYKFQCGKKNAGSVGLGLNITKKLVEAHGGCIWAESRVGKGTVLYFTLPVA